MLPDAPQFQSFFGNIPNFIEPEQRVLPYLPNRMSTGTDMFWNAWISQDGKFLTGNVSSRPVLVPKAIDSIVCISTGV
jgi:hypothetical protein